MQLIFKIVLSLFIILTATAIGKRFPSMGGLVSVMPLTGLLVLVWMYLENKGNPEIMQSFTKGALWGILPTFLFFAAAFFCFKKNMPLSITLTASFSVWLCAAVVHQWILR